MMERTRTRSPAKRNNSDGENTMSTSTSTPSKIPKLSTPKTPMSNRRILGEIDTRVPAAGRVAQAQAHPLRNCTKLKEDATTKQKKKVAKILNNIMTKTQQTPVEKELVNYIEDPSVFAEPISGLIKSVRLYNFMCHESFYKEFHPNLNFITGENGSGKSAVLSGILVGLGAKALTTARTKSVKSLVKTGKEFAKIEIELINRGVLDLQKYGEKFMVERVIDSKGSSTYKLRSHGKLRPLRKFELDYILLSLGIQLDNPVAILNQETARSFLRSKNPKDKYKLFYEGTLLRASDDLLTESKQNIEASGENFNKSKEVIAAQRVELDRLKGILRKIAQVDKMKQNISTMEIEFIWSKVMAIELTLCSQRKRVIEKNQKLKKFEESSQQLVDEKQKLTEEASPGSKQKEELKKELQLKETLLENSRQEWTRLQKFLSENNAKLRSGEAKRSILSKSVNNLEKRTEKMKKESQEAADEKKKELAERKLQLETEKAKLNAEISTLKADSEQFRHGAEACRNDLNQLEDEMRQLNLQLSRKKTELEGINKKTANKYAIFGRDMETLVAKIKANQNSFRKQPRGPLGSCFTVKNPKWLPVIEHVMGNHIHTFLVDNTEDMALLNKLISQIYGRNSFGNGNSKRPNVFLSEFATEPFIYSKGSATMKNHPTIFDMVKIENDDFIVKNALCDKVKIERYLLFDNKLEALETLKNSNSPGFPRNCIHGYSLDFYKVTPDPYFRADALNKNKNGQCYLRSDTQNVQKTLQEEIIGLETQCKEMRPKIEAKRKEESEIRREYSKREEKRSTLQRRCHEIGIDIEALSKKSNTREADVNSHIEELHERQSELTSVIEGIEAARNRIAEREEDVESLKVQKVKLEEEIQDFREKISQVEGSKDLLKGKLEKLNLMLQKIINLKRQVQSDKDQLEREVSDSERELQVKQAEAETMGAKIQTNRNANEIKSEIASFKAKIIEAEKHLGDKKKITNELRETQRKFEVLQKDFTEWHNLFEMLRTTVGVQDKEFRKSITTTTTSLQSIFKGLIATRGYKGTLSIDNAKKELFYFVCPDADSSSRISKVLATNDQKAIKNFLVEYGLALSGGECSFSTICFIVSMWQAMQCPFFMLDEFDVFMDAFNRKASQNALFSHAKRFSNRQFFLLSPLELTEVPEPGTASVLRMFPPKRNSKSDGNGNNVQAVDDDDEDDVDVDVAASPPEPGPSKRQRRK